MNTNFYQCLKRFKYIAIIGIFVASLSSPSIVIGQGNNAITIIPPKFELFANPGDTLVEQIRVRNETDFPVTYSVISEDFTTSGEEGHVVLEEDESINSFSLASWVEAEAKELVLQPQEEKSFSFAINVPRDAEPGGHYASILLQTGGDSKTPGAASVAQRVGSLVLLRISGNVVEEASIESFSAPTYLEKGPVPITLRVKNNGNAHIRPQGTLIIKNMFGQKVDEITLDSRNVLPGSVRKMDTIWDKPGILGRYTATLVSTYGQQNQTMTAAVSFTVASKTVLIVGGIILVALIGFFLSLIAGRKRFGKALRVIFSGK